MMHRLLLNPPEGVEIDHIDGNGLNNCRGNLRYATHQQNGCNRRKNDSYTSAYRGVYRSGNKWAAQITFKDKQMRIGTYNNEVDAASAWNCEAIKYYGEFARLNIIEIQK